MVDKLVEGRTMVSFINKNQNHLEKMMKDCYLLIVSSLISWVVRRLINGTLGIETTESGILEA